MQNPRTIRIDTTPTQPEPREKLVEDAELCILELHHAEFESAPNGVVRQAARTFLLA